MPSKKRIAAKGYKKTTGAKIAKGLKKMNRVSKNPLTSAGRKGRKLTRIANRISKK
jgi:hypothetical protein